MKILITGSTGFIGSNLFKCLSDEGHSISTLNRDINLIDEEVENVDYIYHCAANINRSKYKTDPFIDIDTNIKGTISLFEACRKRNPTVKILILSSFLVEYPKDSYSNSKLYIESMADMYNNIYNMNIKIARLTNVIGSKKQSTLINYFIEKAINNENINIFNKHFTRDYIYIDDVISAMVCILELGENSKRYYIGSGESFESDYVLKKILEKTNSKSKIVYVETPEYSKKVDLEYFKADISDTIKLGWEPKFNFETLLNKMIWSFKNE